MKQFIIAVMILLVGATGARALPVTFTESWNLDNKLSEGSKKEFVFDLGASGNTANVYAGSRQYSLLPSTDASGFLSGTAVQSALLTLRLYDNDSPMEQVKAFWEWSGGKHDLLNALLSLGGEGLMEFDLVDLKIFDPHGKLTVEAVNTPNFNNNFFAGAALEVSTKASQPAPVPEPGTVVLFGAGLALLPFCRRRHSLQSGR